MLLIGQIITAIISTLTIIWMARILGPTEYGQYTIALLPVSIALLFQDLGMNTALVRFSALYRHEGQLNKLKSVVITGLVFSVATSILLSGAMYAFAGPIASGFLKRPDMTPLVQAAALSVLGGGGLLSTIQVILVGYELMGFRSLSQIIWSVTRTVFTVGFLLIGMGAFGAVLANTVSQLVVGLLGVFLIFIIIKFEGNGIGLSFTTLKELLNYGLPVFMGAFLGAVLGQIYNSIMVIYVATDLIGNYGAATNFAVLVSFITMPLATTLFPLFSKFKKDDQQLKSVYQIAVKYTTMLTLPVVLVLIVLSSSLSNILYGAEYPFVAQYLSLFILTYVWEGLGGISLNNLIFGIGESKVMFRSDLCSFIIGATLVIVLGPTFGMIGILVTMLISPRAGWLYQTIWAKKNLNLNVDLNSTLRNLFGRFDSFDSNLSTDKLSQSTSMGDSRIGRGSLLSNLHIRSTSNRSTENKGSRST